MDKQQIVSINSKAWDGPHSLYFFRAGWIPGLKVKSKLPFDPINDLPEPELTELIQKGGPLFFSHTLDSLIGGQIRAGFRLVDLYEDHEPHDEISKYTPTYIATKAIKD